MNNKYLNGRRAAQNLSTGSACISVLTTCVTFLSLPECKKSLSTRSLSIIGTTPSHQQAEKGNRGEKQCWGGEPREWRAGVAIGRNLPCSLFASRRLLLTVFTFLWHRKPIKACCIVLHACIVFRWPFSHFIAELSSFLGSSGSVLLLQESRTSFIIGNCTTRT
jgi:hypothetical protein